MYDLDNGTEDIKVKKIRLEYNTIYIEKEADGYLHIINQIEGIYLETGYGSQVVIDDGGFNVLINNEELTVITNNGSLFKVPVYFSPYTTALRPTSATEGAVIYDSILKKCILWNGTAWVNLDGTVLS